MKKVISADHSGFTCSFEAIATKEEAMRFVNEIKSDLEGIAEMEYEVHCNDGTWGDAMKGITTQWDEEIQKFLDGKITELKCFAPSQRFDNNQFLIKKGAALGGNSYRINALYDGGDMHEMNVDFEKFLVKICSPYSGMPDKIEIKIKGSEISQKSVYDAIHEP